MNDPTSPVPPPKTTGGGWRWEPPEPEELQRILPQYQVECLIGRGGMGAVYKGIQLSLDRPVAIKLLPPAIEQQDGAFAERFKNEARLMGRMNHPAIVSVYDFGRTTEGQLYFVMEFVDGTDVQRMIAREGRLTPEHALAVTAHLCDALGYAHRQGIVHRDIKPSNVLIDSDGRVKVADFGLAKITNSAPNSGLTQTGMAMGTPDYVAPEALTLGVDVDGRADIYAVGVMLYQMLTGDIPRGMFKMPSQKFKAIDPRFDGIVRRALEHDREDRYQTSLELRRDLDVILTTPLAVAGQESSAVLPKQPAQTPGRTVVPSSRSPASMPQRRARPQYEAPPPEPPRSQSSTLPYVLAALGMLGIGGWFVMNPGALHQPEEIPQPPAGAVNPFDALITSPGSDGNDPGRVTPPSPMPTASVTPRPAASSPGPTSPSPSGGAASSVSAANRAQNTPKVPTPAPPPVVQPASIPKTVAEELALLESQFQSAFEREVNAQYADQIATLGINYLAALDREQAEASRAGRSNEATALREERSRYVTHKFMPSIDPASLHATIVRLRNTYREMEKVYSQKKDADSLPLYDLYIQVLNAMEKRLSGEGRVGDAGRVRVKRDDVIARRKQRAAKVTSRAALPPHARRNEAFLAADVFSNEAVLRELC